MDNGRDILINLVRDRCPERLKQIRYQTFRDKFKLGPAGPTIAGPPKAFMSATKALDKWDDDTIPSEFGMNTIFVLDSLTSFGRGAYQWAKAISPTVKHKQQWYQTAQDIVEDTIAGLTAEDFKTNVLVITHIDAADPEKGSTKDFPAAIGKALGPKLGRYFNTLILADTRGSGKNVVREIKTVSTPMMDLKSANPMKVEATYDISIGLASIFKALTSSPTE